MQAKEAGRRQDASSERIWLALAALRLSAAPAQAQLNPSRQITIVVPIGAGGGVDATGRLIAEKLQERLKQPVVVENRPAGGGMVGADSVAKAAPDGHTLLLMETSAGAAQVAAQQCALRCGHGLRADRAGRDLAADPVRAVRRSRPTTSRELIALAKAEPGKLSVGTPGIGTPHHLAMLMLNALAKIDIVNVPYRGAALALNDRARGQIPLGWAAPTAVMPHVAAGKVKILGVASAQRAASLPQVPTIAESGVPGFDLDIWFGVSAPAKTPPDVVARYQGDRRDRRAARREGADREVRLEPRLRRRRDIPQADPRRSRALRQDHPRGGHQAELKGRPLQVIIIGGGIAGLSQALSLHQIGIACRVYDAVPVLARSATASTCSRTPSAS